MLKAVKVRLYPSAEQEKALAFQFGAVRWIYNFALEWRRTAWAETGARVTRRMTLDRLVELKAAEETTWLRDADSQALQQAMIHLDDAFGRFFGKRGRHPRFKNRHGRQSMSYPQRVKVVDGRSLYLPKVGTVRAVLHREIAGRIKTVTVSRARTGKYHASILVDDGQPVPEPAPSIDADRVVGLDMGIAHLVSASSGGQVDNPRFVTRAAANLRRKQKALSRKRRGSANRGKARALVARAHERTANARNDFQHKLSRRLIDENQAVCVETLRVGNMLGNGKLARHIADAAWGALVRKLAYKAEWSGRHLVRIDRWFASSKTCSGCGSGVGDMPLSVRHWTCRTCGREHDRDINAARNIRWQGILKMKAEGLSVSACGGSRKTDTLSAAA